MSFRRRMLYERHDASAWQRATLFGLMLAVAVGSPAFSSPEPRAIRVGATANTATAAEATLEDTDTGLPNRITAASFQDIWVEPSSPTWWQDVTYVAPPAGIVIDEPLIVEVNATDARGAPLIDALVEVTWQLDGEQFRSSNRTNALGRTTTRRLIPASCKGKRCVVAVRVTRDDLERLAYSAFVPQ
jgi:protocatechuate 3,4-dioxygenase beta subunit